MEADGIPTKLLDLIELYYKDTKALVRTPEGDSTIFNIHSGVRQGCPLSPVLFNYVIGKLQWRQYDCAKSITDLMFADNIAFFTNNYADLNGALHKINDISKTVGMKISAYKTQIMDINPTEE